MLDVLAVVIAGVCGAGFVSFLRAFRTDRTQLPPAAGPPESRGEAVRRVLKHLQRRTIAELQDGDAAVVVGTVRAIAGVAPLRAPYSGQLCLGYHLEVWLASLDPRLHLPRVHESAAIVDIEVEDATGVLRVKREGLELAITDGFGTYHHELPPQLHGLVAVPPRSFAVTVEEGLLQPGMKILVCGIASCEQLATDYRDGTSMLVLRASATFPLVASTDRDLMTPGDRPIAPEELRRR